MNGRAAATLSLRRPFERLLRRSGAASPDDVAPVRTRSCGVLAPLMARYTTDHLVDTDRRAFHARIAELLALSDAPMEGLASADRQRDLTVRFQWGHDHDFGSFSLKGRMGDRHVPLVAAFHDDLGALPLDLKGKRVLDIGCWTGGTSLLLAAMGAEVVAVEEVRKYVDALRFLKDSFGIDNLEPRHMSLYDCDTPEFHDSFDHVLFAGVLYHLSDPVLGLRITYNALREGGSCLLETAAVDRAGPVVEYRGPAAFNGGRHRVGRRGGWNWFVPSPAALEQMMLDAGYAAVTVTPPVRGRAMAVGTRHGHNEITRAGLSRPGVR